MSFQHTLERLLRYDGKPATCIDSQVYETWQMQQFRPIEKKEFPVEAEELAEPMERRVKWLTGDTEAASTASLKAVIIRTERGTQDSSKKDLLMHAAKLKGVFESAKLPVAGLLAYLKNMAQFWCVTNTTFAGDGNCSYFFSDPKFCWAWSFCFRKRTTRAILLCHEGESDQFLEDCRAILERLTDFVDQPLLLSYVCMEIKAAHECTLISGVIIPGVLRVERSTGLETWDPGSETVLDRLEDAVGETDNLSVVLLSQRVTDIRFRLGVLAEYIPVVQRQNQRFAASIQSQYDARNLHGQEQLRRSAQLEEVMEYLEDYIKVRLLKVESLANRITSQVVAVEKLQALKSSRENQLIAEESKRIAEDSHLLAKEGTRDSKGMMTIAVVTMIFLPGTFVAAYFAMPIFRWDAPDGSGVVNPRIWIYWVVTIPITTMVLGVWVTYRILINRRERMEDIKVAHKTYRPKGWLFESISSV